MQQFTREQIQAKFDEVSPFLKKTILSAENFEILNEIGKKQALHIDQLGILSTEINLAMLGLTPPADFQGRITELLKLSPEQAKNLTEDVNSQIFLKARELMQRLMDEEEEAQRYEKEAEIRADEEALEEKNEKLEAQAEKRAIVDSLITKPPVQQADLLGAQKEAKASILADIENPPETPLHRPTPQVANLETKTVDTKQSPEVTTPPVAPVQPTPIVPKIATELKTVSVPTPPAAAEQKPLPQTPAPAQAAVSSEEPPTSLPTHIAPVKVDATTQSVPKPKIDPYREAF